MGSRERGVGVVGIKTGKHEKEGEERKKVFE